MKRVAPWVALLALAMSCRFDPAYRDVPVTTPATCTVGQLSCQGANVARCDANGSGQTWTITDDCASKNLTCSPGLYACTACPPGQSSCDGQNVTMCDPTGMTTTVTAMCDPTQGFACRGGACENLCQLAEQDHSNIGCEYWGADLDNADISASLNAAAQQYAIVVSNATPDVPATVTIQQDNALPGTPSDLSVVGQAVIAPQNLEVFKLGPREVDGSPDGQFNTGTGTALTRHAYRITSTMPIVAYQFNPLDNVNVFSNDASVLLPATALNSGTGRAYVVAGWKQTIAVSSNPAQDFGINLRVFLCILGTRADTHVHIATTARVIPGGPFPMGLDQGAQADVVLQPFDVLNLETGDFNADFTGTLLDADQPIAVFPGSEASDAPFFTSIANRFCCADHLENQATPVRTVGQTYAVARMPNRTGAVAAAGGDVAVVNSPEWYRVVSATAGTTHVTTTLPAPYDAFDLVGEGADQVFTALQDFSVSADQAATLIGLQASQDATGVPDGLPGGDPSLVYIPPVEQWRSDYVLLTPDKYVFDYLVLVATHGTSVYIDGLLMDATTCDVADVDGVGQAAAYTRYLCQLSYPVIDPTAAPPNNILPGHQNDGVHHVQADFPVGVIAYGFDSYVSYGYAGGTQLTEINTK